MKKLIIIAASICFFTACTSLKPRSGASFSIHEATLSTLHSAIEEGTLCESITSRYIKQIEKYDKAAGFNAIILINPNAINRAKQLDKAFKTTGKQASLHCAPVILKDNFDTADMPTEAGAIALKGSIPPDDAFMVKKLRQAGAIIIAKSNMAEWAFSPYATISSTHGETTNAYDITRVPAGSSGGTATAIAANFGIIGMGSDTGNSIRGPASHLSLVGIRSTIGMTSRDGVVPLLLNRDIAGPLTRTVEDAAKIFNIVGGYDPADPSTTPAQKYFKNDYTVFLKKSGLQNARLGVLRQIYDESSDPEIIIIFDQAIKDLSKSGATIIDNVQIENFDPLKNATGFCSRFRYDLDNYLHSLGTAAPVKNLQEIIDRKLFDERNAGAMKWAGAINIKPEEQSPPCIDVEGDPRRNQFRNAVLATMKEHKIDAIIYPSWTNAPRKIGDLKSPHGNQSPVIAPHTGQPAMTVPMGFTQAGLPVGLQFLAAPFEEHKLFQYTYAYEQATLHRRPPKIIMK